MKKSTSQPLFEVRHSPIHGYGVFALRRIRKGMTVTEYLGERVSHDEADSRYEDKDPNDNHTFLFTVDSKTVIDGGVGGNDARYINHGCDPNCESTTQNKRIYVEAIRTIEPGEELAYDYQIERDPEDPPNVDEIFACRCGAEKCRGSMLVAPKAARKKRRKGSKAVKTAGKNARQTSVKAGAKTRSQGGPKGREKRGTKGDVKGAAKTGGKRGTSVGAKSRARAGAKQGAKRGARVGAKDGITAKSRAKAGAKGRLNTESKTGSKGISAALAGTASTRRRSGR